MTLTAAEIESVRRYLGYPGDQVNTQAITTRCNTYLTAQAEETVRGHLRELDRLQQQMKTTVPFAAQTFSSGAGGTQQYAPGQRMASFHNEANQYITEISSTTGL